MTLSAEFLRQVLAYDPDTGVFTWRRRGRADDMTMRIWNDRFAGKVAGYVSARGYRAIGVLNRLYPAHRLAWLYVYGTWPTQQIDHINRERDDNRIANLRDVSNTDNAWNKNTQRRSSTGVTGVTEYSWHGRLRYVARIRHQRRLIHLGYFDTVSAATAARIEAEQRLGVAT